MLRYIAPKGFLARALLLLVLPMILVQATLLYVFFERHTETVVRNQAAQIAGEIRIIQELYARNIKDAKHWAKDHLFFEILEKKLIQEKAPKTWLGNFLDQALSQHVSGDYTFDIQDQDIIVQFKPKDRYICFITPKKRLFSKTTFLVLILTGLAAIVFLGISWIILVRQVRPIQKLANVSLHDLDIALDIEGSTELRQASENLNLMQQRLKEVDTERLQMLTGISHDLRTPLTRIKLRLAILAPEEQNAINKDISLMQQMLDSFLDFAQNQTQEEFQEVEISSFITEILQSLAYKGELQLEKRNFFLKKLLFKRCLTNLVVNCTRYASNTWIAVSVNSKGLLLVVDDDGPGIDPKFYSMVLRPFYRLDTARNSSGLGLGLAIVKNCVAAHFGKLELKVSPHGGLRVEIKLPAQHKLQGVKK